METFKQFIRPFCKLEKSITYLKFGCSYRCGNAFRKTMMTRHILIPVCTHIFHSGTPICAKQGVPDACIKIPSENPDRVLKVPLGGLQVSPRALFLDLCYSRCTLMILQKIYGLETKTFC